MSILKQSSHQSFKVTKLCPSVAICEAVGSDRFNWGKATEDEPAFIVYLGCRTQDVAGYVKTLNTFYRCPKCEVRKPKYLKDFDAEIKIRGMQRYCDRYAFGLDYLVESETDKHFEIDFDEYNYYTSGVLPRW
jgi:predicted ATP-dependent Lon-type protease